MSQNQQFALVVAVPLAWALAYIFFLDERLGVGTAVAVGAVLGGLVLTFALLSARSSNGRRGAG